MLERPLKAVRGDRPLADGFKYLISDLGLVVAGAGEQSAGVGADLLRDTDGDGVENARDNCPFDMNMLQGDEDKDGMGDVCDHSDDRWSEKRPWLLYGSMALVVVALVGLGGVILKRSPQE